MSTLDEQFTTLSQQLFSADDAGVDGAREVGRTVGERVFATDDTAVLMAGIINMEAYFHHMRRAALAALQRQLAWRYRSLRVIHQNDEKMQVELDDGSCLPLPGHTAPALTELVAKLNPAPGCDEPRTCLELIQQAGRLMHVLGMTRLVMAKETA